MTLDMDYEKGTPVAQFLGSHKLTPHKLNQKKVATTQFKIPLFKVKPEQPLSRAVSLLEFASQDQSWFPTEKSKTPLSCQFLRGTQTTLCFEFVAFSTMPDMPMFIKSWLSDLS